LTTVALGDELEEIGEGRILHRYDIFSYPTPSRRSIEDM
jgi:hypothetical protein